MEEDRLWVCSSKARMNKWSCWEEGGKRINLALTICCYVSKPAREILIGSGWLGVPPFPRWFPWFSCFHLCRKNKPDFLFGSGTSTLECSHSVIFPLGFRSILHSHFHSFIHSHFPKQINLAACVAPRGDLAFHETAQPHFFFPLWHCLVKWLVVGQKVCLRQQQCCTACRLPWDLKGGRGCRARGSLRFPFDPESSRESQSQSEDYFRHFFSFKQIISESLEIRLDFFMFRAMLRHRPRHTMRFWGKIHSKFKIQKSKNQKK